MGQRMEAAFKMNPNGGDTGERGVGVGTGSQTLSNYSPSTLTDNNTSHTKSSATSSLLSTLQRHRNKNKMESSKPQQLKVVVEENKREKRSSSSPLKTFFNKIGSRGMLLYSSRQELVVNNHPVASDDIMAYDQKQPLVMKSEKDPPQTPHQMSSNKKHNIYHRNSLSSHSRSEFFTYIKCDDPTDGLSLDRKSPERIEKKILEESLQREQIKKTSSLKRSHFPYSFLRSKLGTLPEDDKHLLINHSSEIDVSRQNSITSLDYRPTPHRQLSAVRRLSRHLSSNESGYESDSGRNVDSGGELTKFSHGITSPDEPQDVAKVRPHQQRQLVIKQLSDSEEVGIVPGWKLLPNGQIPVIVVTGLLETGAAFR